MKLVVVVCSPGSRRNGRHGGRNVGRWWWGQAGRWWYSRGHAQVDRAPPGGLRH